ncbi:MAG: putative aldose reductase [Streblomastix strix]|uniref:Putative aldose reductase n=1 Tax=Streblomastix strix TaxID=222440 RepID=A0A5J4UFQ0_9EUKA|nr:MAG: putative aldose reductase [Streblomastix strix]
MLFSTLADGSQIPVVGLGTFSSKPEEVLQAVKAAIEIGYRHFDFAYSYQNQKEIGIALKEVFTEGKVKREDLWLTSKLFCHHHNQADVINELKETLTDLQVSYLDLFLIHLPVWFDINYFTIL